MTVMEPAERFRDPQTAARKERPKPKAVPTQTSAA
jgi:hypothetical protein